MVLAGAREVLDPRGVAASRKLVPNPDEMEIMEGFFKVLGDSTRLRILHALLAGERCVGDLAEVLSTSVSAVSHQLSVLKAARLVRHRREGRVVYYSLSDDHVSSLLRSVRSHLAEGSVRA